MSDKFDVYRSIAAIQGELAKEGISKSRRNQQQGFQYRGIDDVYAALAPLLAEHKLCILPRIVSKEVVERVNAKGTALFYTTVAAEFDMVSAIDGSRHTVSSYGEAMDSGDKSIGKAMSYAYKAMAFMAFAIPTEGDNDPDANAHEVQPKEQPQITEPTTARTDLYNALGQVYHGNEAEMADALRSYSEFDGKDGSKKFLTIANLQHPTANEKLHKWFESTLKKLVADSKKP